MAVNLSFNSGFSGHSPQQVFGKLTDRAVLDRVMLESDSLEPLVEVSETDGHTSIHIRRGFEQEWPPLVSALIGKRLDIEERRIWQRTGPDSYEGSLHLRVLGQPVEYHAIMSLGIDLAEGVTMLRIDGQVNANVMFIGGAVASMAADVINSAIQQETQIISLDLQ